MDLKKIIGKARAMRSLSILASMFRKPRIDRARKREIVLIGGTLWRNKWSLIIPVRCYKGYCLAGENGQMLCIYHDEYIKFKMPILIELDLLEAIEKGKFKCDGCLEKWIIDKFKRLGIVWGVVDGSKVKGARGKTLLITRADWLLRHSTTNYPSAILYR
ncbi:MAG: hypothetical protein JZD41_05835 [Thermoproteus sp.]|nr:hypothetical protein [Thermoproteus sp.]